MLYDALVGDVFAGLVRVALDDAATEAHVRGVRAYLTGVVDGAVNAHVTFDLAFALSAVGVADDRRTKYRDHQRINVVLWRLLDVTLDRLAERYAPGIAKLTAVVGPFLRGCCFGALVLGREFAWWTALLVTAFPNGPLARAVRWSVAAVSAAVAGAVLGPTAHPISARVLRTVAGLFGVRRL